MERVILHCDMNNFYASVECMLNPALQDYPVAVCGDSDLRQGIVLAKNYLAKAYGVQTGEPVFAAKRKCKNLVTVPPHFEEYERISERAYAIYYDYTDLVEPMGLDECWLDVTGSLKLFGDGETIAHIIRERIKSELGVTISVGVSFNKVFSKLGSDMKKPDAVTVIDSATFKDKIWHLPATDMIGVGRSSGEALAKMGVCTIGDLANMPAGYLKYKFGKAGLSMHRNANGLDTDAVIPRDDIPDKSVGHGVTAVRDLESDGEVYSMILELSEDIGHRLYVSDKAACGVVISIKNTRFITVSRQTNLPVATQSPSEIARVAYELFLKNYTWDENVRALTVRATNLISYDEPIQLDIFSCADSLHKIEKRDRAVENIRNEFGRKSLFLASAMINYKMPHKNRPKRIF